MFSPHILAVLTPLLTVVGLVTQSASGQVALPNALPIPLVQALPQPYEQVSFQRDGIELARLHFGPGLNRPFVFPLLGPSGRSVTRMGHPHDPVSHSHHNSIWVSHNDVNGWSFWADRGTNQGRIVGQRLEKLEDGDTAAGATIFNHWVDQHGKVLLEERRRVSLELLPNQESLLVLDLRFEAKGAPVTFGKTPFGLVGVRLAKTIGIADGGGTIRNSEGNVDEQGDNGCFWKRARWCDYSGPMLPGKPEGATLLDHPANPNHPTFFHVRSDGWMGTAFTHDASRVVEPGKPLQLRYAVYVHAGVPARETLQRQWEAFAKTPFPDLSGKRK
ncbi:MAG: hypothetical protein RL514_2332 [Verrucomicrobiota bacterium]|jgi:hypothetical protein